MRSTAARPARRRRTPDAAVRPPLVPRAGAILAAAALLLMATVPAAPASGAEVHEEAVIEASVSTVAAGAELALSGRDFAAGEDHRLRLVGVLEEHGLGDVTPDSAGTFERSVRIPRGAGEGRYQIEAVAPDGDVVARLSITVVEGSGAGGAGAADEEPGASSRAADPGAADAGGARGTATREEATAEELEIDHSRSALGWTVVLLLVGGAGGMGLRLLRRRA